MDTSSSAETNNNNQEQQQQQLPPPAATSTEQQTTQQQTTTNNNEQQSQPQQQQQQATNTYTNNNNNNNNNYTSNAAAAVAPRQDQGECLTNIWGVIIRVPVNIFGVEQSTRLEVSKPVTTSDNNNNSSNDINASQQQQQPLYSTTLNVPCPPFTLEDTLAIQQYAIHKVHKANPKSLCREFYHNSLKFYTENNNNNNNTSADTENNNNNQQQQQFCPKGNRCEDMHIDYLYIQNLLATARVTQVVSSASLQAQQQQREREMKQQQQQQQNSGELPPPADQQQQQQEASSSSSASAQYRIKINDCCNFDGCLFSRVTLGNNFNTQNSSSNGKNCTNITNNNAWQLSTLGPIFIPELSLTVPIERISMTRGYLKCIRSASPQALASSVMNSNASNNPAHAANGTNGGCGVTVCNTFDLRPVPLCQAHVYSPTGCPNGKECQSLHVCRQFVLHVRKLQQEQQQNAMLSGNSSAGGNNNNNNNYNNNNNNHHHQNQFQQQNHHGSGGYYQHHHHHHHRGSGSNLSSAHQTPNFGGNPVSMIRN